MCNFELWVDFAGYLPCHCIFEIKQSGQFTGICQGCTHVQLVYFEDLRLNSNTLINHIKIADYDEICIQRLGDTNGSGPTGLEIFWKAEMVQRKLKIVTGNGEEASRVKALVKGVAGKESPIQVRFGCPERLSNGSTRTRRPPVE